jgi:hypothetical protein
LRSPRPIKIKYLHYFCGGTHAREIHGSALRKHATFSPEIVVSKLETSADLLEFAPKGGSPSSQHMSSLKQTICKIEN